MSDLTCETFILHSGDWSITRTLKLYDGYSCGYCEVISNHGHVLSCVQLNGAPRMSLEDVLEKFIKQPQLPPMDCSSELVELERR